MELLSDGKYIVFKVARFEEMLRELASLMVENETKGINYDDEIEEILNGFAVPDSTVIRAQDIFAAPALYAYSNAIRVATMVMRNSNSVDPAQIKRLDDLAEFFSERADEAAESEFKKLPD